MNSVGLNIFIAIVGISAGPGFINGLKTQGIGLFLWGAVATTVPLILGMLVAKFVFRFHDALTLGIVAPGRARRRHRLVWSATQAKSQLPRSLHTVTTRWHHPLLTIWGMVYHHVAFVSAHFPPMIETKRRKRQTHKIKSWT